MMIRRLPILVLLSFAWLVNAQTTGNSWNELKKALTERNESIIEILHSSADFKEIPEDLKSNIQLSIDSISTLTTSKQQPTKKLIGRLGRSNRYLTSLMGRLLTYLQGSPGRSNYGNGVRLTSIYNNAEEKWRGVVKRYNSQVKAIKRKDLIFYLP